MIQVWSNWFQILSRFFAILGFYGILSHRYETSWIVFLSFLYHSLWDFFYFKNLKGFIEFFLDSCWDLTVGLEISFYLTTLTLSKYFQNQYFHESFWIVWWIKILLRESIGIQEFHRNMLYKSLSYNQLYIYFIFLSIWKKNVKILCGLSFIHSFFYLFTYFLLRVANKGRFGRTFGRQWWRTLDISRNNLSRFWLCGWSSARDLPQSHQNSVLDCG